ncbi:alkylmercury lyase family protein [Sphingopyxis sp. SE2]|uniref:alkylmercury lyase family protein n=1 Tax=Sphingopyxis sp. SE2 TaxID=1586240 RepID=UPI0028C0EE8A|nr:alkylmercury lyase family protein [Sphingopyxis sp. SE2]MDT7531282.1 alkylmercury lyase family protein [Sphingopyxis sp. SE2]
MDRLHQNSSANVTSRSIGQLGVAADHLSHAQLDLPSPIVRFHRAILRRFAESGLAPTVGDLGIEAAKLGLSAGAALETLEARDLITRDTATGAIKSAYPFSAKPTRHRVRISGGNAVYAMCAVDALGIPYMLARDATIESEDPINGSSIRIDVREGEAVWTPSSTVVFAGSNGADGSIAQTCCVVVNFFSSAETAEAFQRARPEVEGSVLSQAEALDLGRKVFSGLLSESF